MIVLVHLLNFSGINLNPWMCLFPITYGQTQGDVSMGLFACHSPIWRQRSINRIFDIVPRPLNHSYNRPNSKGQLLKIITRKKIPHKCELLQLLIEDIECSEIFFNWQSWDWLQINNNVMKFTNKLCTPSWQPNERKPFYSLKVKSCIKDSSEP